MMRRSEKELLSTALSELVSFERAQFYSCQFVRLRVARDRQLDLIGNLRRGLACAPRGASQRLAWAAHNGEGGRGMRCGAGWQGRSGVGC